MTQKPRETLMRMRLQELRELAEDNARKLGLAAEVASLDKRGLASLVMDQARRLSARAGRQGE